MVSIQITRVLPLILLPILLFSQLSAAFQSITFPRTTSLSTTTTTVHRSNYLDKSSRDEMSLFNTNNKKGSARFTGIDQQDATSGFDLVLRSIVSDIGSIVIGSIGICVALAYRLANQDSLGVETLGQETRTDLLAVFASGAVLLNGISKLDVTSALAESVVLDGIELKEPQIFGRVDNGETLWALTSFLKATPSMTAVLLEFVDDDNNNSESALSCWNTVACLGIVPKEEDFRRGTTLNVNPILDRFRRTETTTTTRRETYLPTLQALPGRVEFSYLPENTQEALLLPVASSEAATTRVLVLGSNTAKSFTPRDIAWCQAVAARIRDQ